MNSSFSALNPLTLVMAGVIGIAACVDATAQTTFNVGATSTSTNTAVLWFKPTSPVAWTEAHYIASTGQENVRMTYNSAAGRWEQAITASTGQTVMANFTYLLGSAGYNSSDNLLPVVVSGSTSSASSAASVSSVTSSNASSTASSAAGVSMNADDNGSSVIIWLKPTGQSLGWVDIHYNLNGTGQQNFRMAYSTTNGRYEQKVDVAAGAAVSLPYSFTYGTPTGVVENPGGKFVRTTASSSSTAFSSVASSSKSSTSVASSLASSSVSGFSVNGVALSPTSALFTVNNAVMADVHFTVNGLRQDFRMTHNADNSNSYTATGLTAGALVSYSFTVGKTSTVTLEDVAGGQFTLPSTSSAASSTKSSSSVATSAASSASSLSSSSASSVATGDYSVGITEVGGNVTFKFTSNVNQTRPDGTKKVYFHYYLNGDTSTQDNPPMSLVSENGSTSVWSIQKRGLAAGTIISYGFTYYKPSVSGNWDTEFKPYKVGGSVGAIPAPTFYPAPGVYTSDKQITLTTSDGSSIYYTTDGSTPAIGSPSLITYNAPISVTLGSGVWIQAIAVNAKGEQSSIVEGSYSVDKALTSLSAPTFSHLSGTYNTVIRPTIAHPIEGVEVFYTTNGQEPEPLVGLPVLGADGKPVNKTVRYTKALQIAIDKEHTDGKWQVKAIAVKNGLKSPVTTVDYTVTTKDYSTPWDQLTTMKVANNSNGKWSNAEVYWTIIGKDWNTGKFVWVDSKGNLVPMELDDSVDFNATDANIYNLKKNPAKTYLAKKGDSTRLYANYFHKLSDVSQVTIPPIDSARMMVSYGTPMYISTNHPPLEPAGTVAYAGANVEDENDPSTDVFFDFMEFAIVPRFGPRDPGFIGGIFINNTRVDMFGFPVQVSVTGKDGFKQTVGESFRESREEIFARFKAEATPEFSALIKAYDVATPPYRIMAPAHDASTFGVIWADANKTTIKKQGIYHDYYDAYIKQVWDHWKTNEMVLALDGGWTFKGKVNASNEFVFTNVDPITQPATDPGIYKINGIPSTQDVFLGNGLLDDNKGQNPDPKSVGRMKQLQIQAQVCAAINRHVAHLDPSNWHNASLFFPAGQVANWYDKLSRVHSLEALSYGFAYSDVGEQSSSIYTWSPETVTFTVGW